MTITRTWTAGGAVLLLGVGALSFAHSPLVSASDLTPATEDEAGLRDAIDIANGNEEPDTITLAAGTITISGAADDDVNASGDFDIAPGGGTLTIEGQGIGATVLDGAGLDRIFDVQPGASLVIRNLTIRNGAVAGASPLADSGGAVLNQGSFTAENVEFTGNTATRAGGAVESSESSTVTDLISVIATGNSTGAAPGNGGALHITDTGASSTVTVTGGSYSGNTAALEGGALWNGSGLMTVSGATFFDNEAAGAAPDDGGGAIFNNGGTLDVSGSTFGVDGSTPAPNSASGTAGSGGALFSTDGDVTVSDSIIANNTANRAGGGIELAAGTLTLTDVDFTGNSALAGGDPTAAAGNGGAVHVTGTASFTASGGSVVGNTANEGGGFWNDAASSSVIGTTFIDNTAVGTWTADDPKGGGALFQNPEGSLSVSGSTISGNSASGSAGSGGGILTVNGSLTVTESTLTDNTSSRAGGGIEATGDDSASAASQTTLDKVMLTGNDAGTSPGNGGGLHITGPGTVDVTRSTVAGNTAVEGGGLWNSGAGTMNISDSTVSDNTSTGGGGGGGLFNDGGTMTVVHGTVTDNSTGVGASGGDVRVENSIVSGNIGDDCESQITSSGGNVLGDSCDGGAGDVTTSDPGLGDLADNGGLALTHMPRSGSPAIDATRNCGSDTDQRGAQRPVDGDRDGIADCDAGSVEALAAPPATPVTRTPTFTG